MWFFVQLCGSWQDFSWLKASRGPSAIAELLVSAAWLDLSWCSAGHDDAAVRLKLLGLLTSSPGDCRQWQQLGRDVVTGLVSLHRQMLGRQGRCYANSVQHRRSYRVMTAVLLLENYAHVWTLMLFRPHRSLCLRCRNRNLVKLSVLFVKLKPVFVKLVKPVSTWFYWRKQKC